MQVRIREFAPADIEAMKTIWNQVVAEGQAFPQENFLDRTGAMLFFSEQTYTAVAELNHEVVGLYILHPNNVGRCGHIGNSSYAVKSDCRGLKIGEKLVLDSLVQAKKYGFKLLQFNAVVKTNIGAIKLYKRLGFKEVGLISGGFRDKEGIYQDIFIFYYDLIGELNV